MKIGILGAGGRMGQELIEALINAEGLSLSGALVRVGSSLEGAAIQGHPSLIYSGSQAQVFDNSDVLIDFTLPEATLGFIEAAETYGKPLMIGTTGLDPLHHQAIQSLAQSVPVVYAPNTSLGINLLYDLVKKAARILGDDFDVEISEMHHRHKRDLPSGAALNLGRHVAQGLEKDFEVIKDIRRENTPRVPGTIGFSSKRGGGVFGDHEVVFASDEEMLTLSHRALNRKFFAKGALRAAKWVATQKPGLYGMRDVLGL